MNGQSPRQPRSGESESMDDAARRLQEEMEVAVRHLREQVLRWRVVGRPEAGESDADGPGRDHET